jgi:hypothetical protein
MSIKLVDAKKIVLFWSLSEQREIFMLEIETNDENTEIFLINFIHEEIKSGRSGEDIFLKIYNNYIKLFS